MDRESEEFVEISDFSRGIQNKTTEFLQDANELTDAKNSRYDTIGGVKPAEGFTQTSVDLTSTTRTSSSTSTTTTSTSTSTSTTTTTSTSTTSTSTSTTA